MNKDGGSVGSSSDDHDGRKRKNRKRIVMTMMMRVMLEVVSRLCGWWRWGRHWL